LARSSRQVGKNGKKKLKEAGVEYKVGFSFQMRALGRAKGRVGYGLGWLLSKFWPIKRQTEFWSNI